MDEKIARPTPIANPNIHVGLSSGVNKMIISPAIKYIISAITSIGRTELIFASFSRIFKMAS